MAQGALYTMESPAPAYEGKLIHDAYSQRRGSPKMLKLFCESCSSYVMHYQKDGPGPLLRCYLDRIHYPEEIKNTQKGTLLCPSCKQIIGTPMIYKPENRPAYRMIKHRFYIQ